MFAIRSADQGQNLQIKHISSFLGEKVFRRKYHVQPQMNLMIKTFLIFSSLLPNEIKKKLELRTSSLK